MNLVTICKLHYIKVNIFKLGGYVTRDLKTIEDVLKFKWVRPQRIPEIQAEQSGDLGINVPMQPNDCRIYYENSKEWEDANDFVKKIFSLEFQPKRETRNFHREKIMGLVKRHICDRGSSESKIAAMTSEILYLQEYMKEHPRNKPTKVFLKELIDKRKKYLKYVRKWDYKRFEWILEQLNLIYKYNPEISGMVSRKNSLTQITEEYCANIIQEKLNAYKNELEVQQKDFFQEKAEKLAFILKEEKECGLKPSVTEEEIEVARKKSKGLKV